MSNVYDRSTCSAELVLRDSVIKKVRSVWRAVRPFEVPNVDTTENPTDTAANNNADAGGSHTAVEEFNIPRNNMSHSVKGEPKGEPVRTHMVNPKSKTRKGKKGTLRIRSSTDSTTKSVEKGALWFISFNKEGEMTPEKSKSQKEKQECLTQPSGQKAEYLTPQKANH